jgi:very-short-patch-repair endonuclease
VINVENDKFKNKLAKENGYNLVRFWGNEIKENDFETKLLKEINRWEKRLE